jgi:alpha-L-rhamnosidase
MRPQAFPAVTVQAELVPTSIASPAPGVFVFDCSQNIAGHVRLTLPAPVPAGLNVKMRHAELLMHPPYGDKDGNIYVGNLRSALATDLYTTKGASEDAEVFEPMFTQVRETKPTRLTTFPTSYR